MFEPYRNTAKRFLEIGVAQGYSLRMWREYFLVTCEVQGIDIDKTELCDSTLDVSYGDSKNKDKWLWCDNYDIIIDDGDHTFEGQIETAQVWIPKLNKNGLYIIEDVSGFNSHMYGQLLFDINRLDLTVDILDMRYVKDRYDDMLVVFSEKGVDHV
jgi:hypothetical protein